MSYQNVFFGDLNNPNFYSRVGDDLDRTEQETYLRSSFVSHPLLTKKNFNLGFHINVYTPESVGVSFYLTNEETHYGEDVKKNIDKSVANIQTHIDLNDRDLTIKWLGVNEEARGQKLGQFLITLALLYTSKFNVEVVNALLDDDSDNYANGIENPGERKLAQSKNIYCKMGFAYEDETGGPEMTGNISEMVKKNIKIFVKERSRTKTLSSSSSSLQSRKKKRR
jgi:GNAT superfamily N-acetyltransferase